MLALAAMITAFLISIGLNRSQAELLSEREDRNMSALRQAKAALIAYAASEEWQLYKALPAVPPAAYYQPGALPCPDKNDDGDADCVGAGITPTSSIIGRLPWKTLGVDDLRDASGERLWYALSWNFRKLQGGSPPTVINSDTQGQLNVTGTAPINNVVAVLFAPGESVLNQTRPSNPANPAHNSPANYLEGFDLSDPVNYVFTSNARPSDTFNDRLLVITQAELMAAVEPVVAARIERDVKPYLNSYASASQWGRFPFPVKFGVGFDPGASGSGTMRPPMTYLGNPVYPPPGSNSYGLLPIAAVAISAASNASPIVITTNSAHNLFDGDEILVSGVQGNTAANGKRTVTVVDATHFQLNGSSGSGSYIRGGTVTRSYPWSGWSVSKTGGSGIIDSILCSTVGPPSSPGLQCMFQAHDEFCGPGNCINNLGFRIQAQVGSNAGRSFARVPNMSDVSTLLDGAPSAFLSDSIAGSLDNTGVGTVTYVATLPFNCTTCNPSYSIIVTIPDVVSSDIASADLTAGWFIANEWYRQTFYAVANDLLPGTPPTTNGNCVANPPCLTVNNLPAKFTAKNDKQAILILAGRTLNGSLRPSGTWNDYMEGANQTATATNTYEHRAGSPSSINDRVVVVAP
ncbi:MAG TPA: ubiquitin-activating E1 FCCH domain-containing protein [Burkholderiales bacterium]|nr:ubiquitin-activating E1 FCCH domain-containing protein [Burkholderiales bacterium]